MAGDTRHPDSERLLSTGLLWRTSGLAHEADGRLTHAAVCLRRSLALFEAAGDAGLMELATTATDLAIVLQMDGRALTEGSRLLQRAIEIRSRLLGPKSAAVGDPLFELAKLRHYDEQDPRGALEPALQALAIRRRLGAVGRPLEDVLAFAGKLLAVLDRVPEAVDLLAERFVSVETRPDATDEERVSAILDVAVRLGPDQEDQRSALIHRALLPAYDAEGDRMKHVENLLATAGAVQLREERFGSAATAFAQCVRMCDGPFIRDPERLACRLVRLAQATSRLAWHPEACEAGAKGIAILGSRYEQAPAPQLAVLYAQMAECVADVLTAAGRQEEAITLLQDAGGNIAARLHDVRRGAEIRARMALAVRIREATEPS